jgi:GDP-4-dehydro-6-deoxy-D-mannose reductase
MRALVIGADGFAGRWLVRELRDAGASVVAAVGPSFRPPLEGVERIEQVDVRDGQRLEDVTEAAGPDVVYYLAGVSQQREREDVSAAIGVTVIGSTNALVACTRVSPRPRMLFVSTGYVYEAGPEPRSEDSPTRPDSLYAAAKLAAEHALLAIGPEVGVEVVVARPFNHIGPGQSDAFVVPTLARQVAALPPGGTGEITVADASVVRDFSDVRDVVAAYRLLAERGRSGEAYNVASGRGTAVEEIGRQLARLAGVDARIVSRDAPMAIASPSRIIGNADKLRSLGWQPRRALEATLKDILEAMPA